MRLIFSGKQSAGLLLLTLFLLLLSCSQEKHRLPGSVASFKGPSEQAIKSWSGQKFSMFIHFGVYSLLGGVYENQPVTYGYSEQIRAHGKISRENYRKIAARFNPVKWNPDSVVALARQAGMKSIVITSKHHDGFAMFNTAETDFDIVDFTPYKRDILKELSEACAKENIKFGVYFSLIDWDFPGAVPISAHNSDSIPPAHHQMNMNQVKELMTGYGPISEIWFDMGKPTFEQSHELANLVHKYQPDCLISGRIWNDQGDFAVMGDNASPDFLMGTLWQAPASMFDETWGYRSWQIRENSSEKTDQKIRALSRVVTNGGNYLLNIGPMGDGEIVPFEKTVLSGIGNWISFNSESIYNTTVPDNFPAQTWGNISYGKKLYLHILNNPINNEINLRGLTSNITSAYFLERPEEKLKFKKSGEGWVISYDLTKRTGFSVPVIAVELSNQLTYKPDHLIKASEAEEFQLSTSNADRYHSYSGKDYYTTKPTLVKMGWNLYAEAKKNKTIQLNFKKADTDKLIRIMFDESGIDIPLNLAEQQNSTDNYQIEIKDIELRQGINRVSLFLTDQSNPHRDIGLESLVIRIY